MDKLTFPTDILPGLVFNDFINKDSSLVCTYARHAVTIKKISRCYALLMDENHSEVIYVDHQHNVPQWLAYDIDRTTTVVKLNWFISSEMTCIMKSKCYQIYKHQSGLCIYIKKNSMHEYTYLLCWLENVR